MKKLLICLTVLFSVFLLNNKVNALETINGNYPDIPAGFDNFIIASKDDGTIRLFAWQSSKSVYAYNYMDTHFQFDDSMKDVPKADSKNVSVYNLKNNNWEYQEITYNASWGFNKVIATTSKIYSCTNGTYVSTSYEVGYGLINKIYNITFHLNGGSSWDTNEICNDIGCYIVGNKYEDYTISVPGDNLISYLGNVYITKVPMQFVGWYYDEKLTQKVEATDTIDSDKDFYAKYQYKNIEDFLNNTTFNSYSFDTNYQYAVISLNDQSNRDIYLGLDIMSHNLEVYKYSKETNSILKGSTLCLTPIYSKENKYYYHLDSPLNSEYEVLILEKNKLKENYEFLLSDNAYITYTNDLKSLIIKDDDGNDLTIDIEDSYNYSQDNLLNSENDLLEIFKDLINNKDNNVFSYFNQVWNLMKQNKLFTYFMLLIIGSLIILIIKAASR